MPRDHYGIFGHSFVFISTLFNAFVCLSSPIFISPFILAPTTIATTIAQPNASNNAHTSCSVRFPRQACSNFNKQTFEGTCPTPDLGEFCCCTGSNVAVPNKKNGKLCHENFGTPECDAVKVCPHQMHSKFYIADFVETSGRSKWA